MPEAWAEDIDWSREKAAICDHDWYIVDLETRQDFGCVLWEPRDDVTQDSEGHT